ncbi:MAG: hypothetical protein JJV90_01540 [Spiroplasma sp.]|nr:hypothetical protein [Mycoplasmatales bacterium]
MLRIKNIKVGIEHSNLDLLNQVSKVLDVTPKLIQDYTIIKKALDSRKKTKMVYIYTIDVKIENEYLYLGHKDVIVVEQFNYEVSSVKNNLERPIIIGSGPAGLLSAIVLAKAGLCPILIEQGRDVELRKKDIDLFWKEGILNPASNVQFGAGGAGTFSDGKLTTGINDKRRDFLLSEFIEAGAPKEIMYLSKAHIGTDILLNVVQNLCNKIISLGGEIWFETKFINFNQVEKNLTQITIEHDNKITNIDCQFLIMAIGHSARDTYEMLYENNFKIQSKSFSIGLRIEHLQSEVNSCQYGEKYPLLDSASYKVSTRTKDNRGVYSFCMCPGGLVVASSSEHNTVVTNGMSYYNRDQINANSAILVSVNPNDFNGDDNPLNGIEFQRKLEHDAFILGGSNYNAPGQLVKDFINKSPSTKFKRIKPSYTPGVTPCNIHDILPKFLSDSLIEGLINLKEGMPIFNNDEAVLTAIESRSSSPIPLNRDETLMSNIKGVIPAGEGAGYAGGIVSAAIDGMKAAENLIAYIEISNHKTK